MKKIFRGSFLKSIATLASGSIIAQIIVLAVSPILTRLYTPEELGIFTFVITITTMFGGVICGRYDMSIVMEENQKRVYSLIKLSLILCLILSFFVSFGYFVYIFLLSDEYKQYVYTVIFVFIILVIKGITLILTSFNNRKKQYSLIMYVNVIRTTSQNIGMVLLGLIKFGVPGLLISYTFGQFLGIKKQANSLKPHLKDIKKIKISEIIEVLKKYYKQPILSAPALFANSFSYSSINLSVQSLYGTAALGLYSISFRALGLPLNVVSGNVAKVFFEEASREYNETGKFIKAFNKTSLFLFVLAIPMVLGMIFIVPPLFGIIFGEDWKEAGEYVKLLAPMFGVRFIVTSLTPGILIANKQDYELYLQFLFILTSMLGFVVSKLMNLQISEFLIFISISFTLIYCVYFVIIFKYSKKISIK